MNANTPQPIHELARLGFLRRSDYCRAVGLGRSTGCERVRSGWPDYRDTEGYSWVNPRVWLAREPARRREAYRHLLMNVYGPSLLEDHVDDSIDDVFRILR